MEENASIVKILKFPVNGSGFPTEFVCRKTRLLDIQLQEDTLVCWVETRDDMPETTTKLISIGTGWEIPVDFMRNFRYFRTVQDAHGFVWHFYEEGYFGG